VLFVKDSRERAFKRFGCGPSPPKAVPAPDVKSNGFEGRIVLPGRSEAFFDIGGGEAADVAKSQNAGSAVPPPRKNRLRPGDFANGMTALFLRAGRLLDGASSDSDSWRWCGWPAA
jgi:hypothetical protein